MLTQCCNLQLIHSIPTSAAIFIIHYNRDQTRSVILISRHSSINCMMIVTSSFCFKTIIFIGIFVHKRKNIKIWLLYHDYFRSLGCLRGLFMQAKTQAFLFYVKISPNNEYIEIHSLSWFSHQMFSYPSDIQRKKHFQVLLIILI